MAEQPTRRGPLHEAVALVPQPPRLAPAAARGPDGHPPAPPPPRLAVPGGDGGARGHHRRAHSTAGGPLRLSDLELLAELGEGAFAQVVACRRRGQSHRFALKVMRKGGLRQAEVRAAALAEKAALAACASPHVATLYYALADAEHWCLLLELCPRGDLHAALERCGPLAPAAAAWLCAEIASGLSHLHAAGWAHRDIKPENVGLSAAGHAKLLDLGSARRLDGRAAAAPGEGGRPAGAAREEAEEAEAEAEQAEQAEREGGRDASERRTAGTAAYVSPEMASGACAGGQASDLWSLGCCLFALLAGRSPFAAPTEYLSLHKAAQGDYAWPRGAQPPHECAHAVRLLLHADPAARLRLGRAAPPAGAPPGAAPGGPCGPGGWLADFAALGAFAALPAPPDGLHALTPPPMHAPRSEPAHPPAAPAGGPAAVTGRMAVAAASSAGALSLLPAAESHAAGSSRAEGSAQGASPRAEGRGGQACAGARLPALQPLPPLPARLAGADGAGGRRATGLGDGTAAAAGHEGLPAMAPGSRNAAGGAAAAAVHSARPRRHSIT